MKPLDTNPTSSRRLERLVVVLCFATICFDGYDLIVYGATLPILLKYEPWGLTPAVAGTIGSAALIGMMIGALVSGAIADVAGRRKTMIIGVAWFSLCMIGCAVAPNPVIFGLFRLLGGIGLGGVMPTAIALTAEFSDPRRRNLNNALMFCGYSVGGVIAAVTALLVMPQAGFRTMYLLGGLPLLLLPVLIKVLPESPAFLRVGEQGHSPKRLADLFRGRTAVAAILFAITSFFGLLLVYGLNTWLPQIMRNAGYPLSNSLLFLVVLNVGAVVGTISASAIADRIGIKPITIIAFASAAVAIAGLSVALSAPLLYTLIAVAGFGTVGAQILVNSYVAQHFGDEIRATALGWTLGMGRIGAIIGPTFGGLLIAAGVGTAWNFYAFAIPAAAAAVITVVLPPVVRTLSARQTLVKEGAS